MRAHYLTQLHVQSIPDKLISKPRLKQLNNFFESTVEVPRIGIGGRQTIETLINEEVLWLAKFLRDECKRGL